MYRRILIVKYVAKIKRGDRGFMVFEMLAKKNGPGKTVIQDSTVYYVIIYIHSLIIGCVTESLYC